MAILIKGMEMPKNCKSCPLRYSSTGYAWCDITGASLALEIDMRDYTCPLVEIPTPDDTFDFYDYTPNEAIKKLKAFEQKQDKIEVGDEVNWLGDCFIVTRIFQPRNGKEQCDGIDDDGCVYHDVLIKDLEKTGRHFDIDKILEAMNHD